MESTKTAEYDAIVVGAGFSGIRSLWELGQQRLTVKCFEAGSDVGGVWYWNRYPGARTDSEAWVYNMNFAPGLSEHWDYRERYPSQTEVQQYLSRIVDRFDLRKHIEFNRHIESAHFSDSDNIWTIKTANGSSTTCRYFIPATGPLSIPKDPPFPGLRSYTGEWYLASNWPSNKVSFHGKRIAVIGTGATGVQIIPKIASVAKQLTVFQRTANYVLPGRNYSIDENQAAEIRQNYDATWDLAKGQAYGMAMIASGRTIKDVTDPEKIRQILDAGWEAGGFHFQFETFDDIFTSQESNDIASEYIRDKIHAIVQNPNTADLLCPKHPFLSKRPPCGHFYYEAYNRPNVKLVDMSRDNITLYEKGIRTDSGSEYEFDMIIFALGFDAATGALSEMDVRGSEGRSLKECWANRLETFAGVLVPGFANMFMVIGPHVPFGNIPVVLNIGVDWIGKTLRHMEDNKLARIDVTKSAVEAWTSHLNEVFSSTLFADSSKAAGAWHVSANIPGKTANVLFYFGGVPSWTAWLNKEFETAWASMDFSPVAVNAKAGKDTSAEVGNQVAADITLVA